MQNTHPDNGEGLRPLTRNPILLSRLFFVLLAMLLGTFIGAGIGDRAIAFCILGLALSGLFVLFEHATNFVSSKSILFAATGGFLGLIFSSLINPVFPPLLLTAWHNGSINAVPLVSHLICSYLGVSLALRHSHRFSFSRLNFILSQPAESEKVLDSSILIDGRILDIIDTNFLSGPFVVPTFVLRELQRLADSSQALKRARGRRALEILETLRTRYGRVRLDESDYAGKSVDQKLITLSREINGTLMTTDYNLQKVAQIHQVRTFNLNELANTLKPSAFVGEELAVHIDRMGKEHTQGVGYLDDGTMMVVEGAAGCVGLEVVVEVTSVLQTVTGRMIFARKIRDTEHVTPMPAALTANVRSTPSPDRAAQNSAHEAGEDHRTTSNGEAHLRENELLGGAGARPFPSPVPVPQAADDSMAQAPDTPAPDATRQPVAPQPVTPGQRPGGGGPPRPQGGAGVGGGKRRPTGPGSGFRKN